MRAATLLVAIGLLVLVGVTGATAQGTAGTTAGNCPLPPVSVPLFQGTPAAQIASTPAAALQVEAPAVDPAAIESASAAIVQCINTGDPSFQYAIFTPRYLATQFVPEAGHYQPEFERILDTPALPATAQFTLESIEIGDVQGDGRIQVTLVLRVDQEIFRDTLLLAYVDDHWLIDDIVALDPPR